jgi:hypothetical protein
MNSRLPITIVVCAAATWSVAAFADNPDPRQACGATTTLGTLIAQFIDGTFKGQNTADRTIISTAIDIRKASFERYDRKSGRIDCKGTLILRAPGYAGYEKQTGQIEFSRVPKAGGFAVSMTPSGDMKLKLTAWIALVVPPSIPGDTKSRIRWQPVSHRPVKVGDCTVTKVAWKGTRLNIDGEDVEGSGSAVKFADGIYQVSYETVNEVDASQVGDPVRICLALLPSDCPKGDNRGKQYGVADLRTGKRWYLPDSEHMCGGA